MTPTFCSFPHFLGLPFTFLIYFSQKTYSALSYCFYLQQFKNKKKMRTSVYCSSTSMLLSIIMWKVEDGSQVCQHGNLQSVVPHCQLRLVGIWWKCLYTWMRSFFHLIMSFDLHNPNFISFYGESSSYFYPTFPS